MRKLIPTYLLIDYLEFDREHESRDESSKISYLFGASFSTNLTSLTEDIRLNGFKKPFILSILGIKALLTDGNHRLSCAVNLLIDEVSVEIEDVNGLTDFTYKEYILSKMEVSSVKIKDDLLSLIK